MAPGITILGLGPGDPKLLTTEAYNVLEEASEIYLRTAQHPTVPALPGNLDVHAFDKVYETHEAFDKVYAEIVARVIQLGQRPQGVLYAVPGHPLVAESTVRQILARGKQLEITIHIVHGLSFIEPVLAALSLDPLDGLQLMDAIQVGMRHHPPLNPDQPALLPQLYNRRLASEVKLTLMNLYPDEHPVTLVTAAGTERETVLEVPLYELDRQESIDHLTTLYISPLPKPGSLNSFLEIVAHLRAPDGCPWDREQNHQTLRASLLEETYEVLDALDREDTVELCEELGDLLLQIVLHTQIAAEFNAFKMPDVAQGIIAKMVRRHPHVFGTTQVADSAQVLKNWAQIKADERQGKEDTSLLSSVPTALPALARALALQKRVTRVGFDWPEIKGVIDKVAEEVGELHAATPEERESELGDILFSLVNLARWLDIDPEVALRLANQRFVQRFRIMEQLAQEQHRSLEELSLAEKDLLWETAKKRFREE
jgi:tetrapyrrole methylase family protein/MazG family protein